MSGLAFYPIICTDKLRDTINFYEDYFGFQPYFEMEYYAYLRHGEHEDMHLGIVDIKNPDLPTGYRDKTVAGVMLTFFTEDVDKLCDEFYMEGVDMTGEIQEERCGRRHFGVFDPNGVLISVSQAGVKPIGNLIEEIRQDYDAVLDKALRQNCANA